MTVQKTATSKLWKSDLDFDAHFQGFLSATVNLKPWKLELLDNRVGAIAKAFQVDAEAGAMYKEHVPQGSWAHQTIINPVGAFDEFDADILLHIEQDRAWNDNPKKYLQQVRAVYKRHTTYQSMVRRKNRCVRIGYANDCHVDVVPSVTLDDGRQMIINYAENVFEETNPVGFADWMKERDGITGGNLRRIIRLFKWLRDYKNTFSCPSVILTVMLGNRVRYWDSDTRYADIPTTLVHLLEDLVTWLDEHPTTMPLLDDPSCPGTSFNHRWDDIKYEVFKKKVADYATWAREAYDLQGDDDQAALVAWQKMFGPEFAADEVKSARSEAMVNKVIAASTALREASNNTETKDAAPHEEFIQHKYNSVALRYDARIDAVALGTYPKTCDDCVSCRSTVISASASSPTLPSHMRCYGRFATTAQRLRECLESCADKSVTEATKAVICSVSPLLIGEFTMSRRTW
jgi:SMODS domain-containing protein